MRETYFMTPGDLDEAEKSKLLRQPWMPAIFMREHSILGAVDVGLSNLHVGRIGGQRDLVRESLYRL
jgi:hypothetical protein